MKADFPLDYLSREMTVLSTIVNSVFSSRPLPHSSLGHWISPQKMYISTVTACHWFARREEAMDIHLFVFLQDMKEISLLWVKGRLLDAQALKTKRLRHFEGWKALRKCVSVCS